MRFLNGIDVDRINGIDFNDLKARIDLIEEKQRLIERVLEDLPGIFAGGDMDHVQGRLISLAYHYRCSVDAFTSRWRVDRINTEIAARSNVRPVVVMNDRVGTII